MFSLSVFSTILLILASFGLLAIFIAYIKYRTSKRSSSKLSSSDDFPGLAYHLSSTETFEPAASPSVKNILKRIWQDLSAFITGLFYFRQSGEEDEESKYDNDEEHRMLESIKRDEGAGAESKSNKAEGKAGKEDKSGLENKESKKLRNIAKSQEKDLTLLFSESAGALGKGHKANIEHESGKKEMQLEEIRAKFLEKRKKSLSLASKLRKEKPGETPFSEADAAFAISMLSDLVHDCHELDKQKIKGRVQFLKSSLKQARK